MDAETGQLYALHSETFDIDRDTDTASSPVTLFDDDSAELLRIVATSSGGGGGGGAVASAPSSSNPLPVIAVIAALVAVILGLVVAGRRLGLDSRRQTLVLGIGALVAGLVGIEWVSPGTTSSIISALTGSLSLGGGGTVIVALVVFVLFYGIQSRFGLPEWLLIVAAVPLGIWVIDSLGDGVLTSGLDEVSALIWVALIGGTFALLWRSLKGPTFRITAKNATKEKNK
jgi:hypothetical protein